MVSWLRCFGFFLVSSRTDARRMFGWCFLLPKGAEWESQLQLGLLIVRSLLLFHCLQ